jgi:hypothetical protein
VTLNPAAPATKTISARTLAARVFVWPACIPALLLHVYGAHDDHPIGARWYAGLLCCLAMVCVAYAPRFTMPIVAVGIGYFYAALGMPVFSRAILNTARGPVRISYRGLEEAATGALLVAGIAVVTAFLADRIGAHLGQRIANGVDGQTPYGVSASSAARWLAGVCTASHLAVSFNLPLGPLKQPLGVLGAPALILPLLFWDWTQTHRRGTWYLLWGIVALLGVRGLLGGMLQDALMPAIVASCLLWWHRGKLPVRVFAAGVVFILIFNPAKHHYRQKAWFSNTPLTSVDRAKLWAEAIEATFTGSSTEENLNQSFESTSSRMNTLVQVGHMFDSVPERIAHAGPDKWLQVPLMLVPRLFWPDKPVQERFFNKDYTFTFGIQDPRRTRGTSITLPTIADGYWRLGWTGVVIEAVLLGFTLGLGQGISRVNARAALLVSAALLQVRTEYHPFGTVTGLIQQCFIALVIAVVANKLGALSGGASLVSRGNAMQRQAAR